MAILGSIFGVLGRFAGKVLNSALGWASLLLFGRVPQSKQYILLGITFGSLVWVLTLLGVLLPDVGTFLLAAVPAPGFVDRNLIRLAMLMAAVVLPLVIGAASLALMGPDVRPRGVGIVRGVLRGYPFAFVLAVSLAFLAVISLVRKLRSLARRWEDTHVAIVVRPGGYEAVVDALREALDGENLGVQPRVAPRTLELPAHLLAAVAEGGVRALVPNRLMELKGVDLDVLVYPSDIAISGTKERVARARGAVATRLTSAPAYMTTSAEAQAVEDRIEGVARQARDAGGRPSAGIVDAARGELERIDKRLRQLTVPYDEWETLYRMRLQVERDLLAAGIGAEGSAAAVTNTRREARNGSLSPALQWAASIAGLSLVALDVLLAVFERVHPAGRRAGARLG